MNKFLSILMAMIYLQCFAFQGVVLADETALAEETASQPLADAESTVEVKEVLSSPDNVTLDLKDADIRNVMRIISMKSNVNIVAGAEVQGPVTIRLVDVPWEKALEVVLKTYGFAYERDGNIIRVTTMDKLATEALETQVYPLTHADAKEVQATLQDMLTERGSIRADMRTNVLIVTDVPTNVYKIGQIIKRLDRGTPQVLIESKIVEMSMNEAERLGVKWNAALELSGSSRPTTFPWGFVQGTDPFNQFLPRGKPGGAIIPIAEDGTIDASSVIEEPEDFPSVGRDDVNGMPKGSAAATFPFATPEDFTFGQIDFSQFKVLLEAIAESGHNKVLSEPRITVLSNQEAKILVGEEIYLPNYERNDDTGAMEITGYTPRSIGIEMVVTPQINQENQVNLQLHPSISSLIGFEELTPDVRVPRIAVRNASTKVRINNGDTVVLGGLIKEDIVDQKTKFPILGDLPVLDKIFSHTDRTVNKTDLMFFITVTVLDEPGVVNVFDESRKS